MKGQTRVRDVFNYEPQTQENNSSHGLLNEII